MTYAAPIVITEEPLTTTLFGAMDFKLNQLPDYSDFTYLFDRYRINAVAVKFYFSGVAGADTTGGAAAPTVSMWIAKDYDDIATGGLSIDTLRQYQNCKLHNVTQGRPVTVKLRPAVASMMYKSDVATGYGPKWKQWVDCTYADVPHFGLKYAINFNSSNVNKWATWPQIMREVTYYLSFKNVH